MKNTFPTKSDIQNSIVDGITVLSDLETFSESEGTIWLPIKTNEYPDTDSIESLLRDNGVEFSLSIDSFPYVVLALFLSLGINAEGLSMDQLINELNECSVSNDNQVEAISALRLALS
jgi:hypothetical protein